MTTSTAVAATKENLLAGLEVLAKAMTDNYDLTGSSGDYKITFKFGTKYIKIIKSYGGAKSVAGFIVNSDNAVFPYGSLLKAASYKAPALNKPRGSVFDLEGKKFAWTGIA